MRQHLLELLVHLLACRARRSDELALDLEYFDGSLNRVEADELQVDFFQVTIPIEVKELRQEPNFVFHPAVRKEDEHSEELDAVNHPV